MSREVIGSGARAWETIAGLQTKRVTVTPAPEGSPTIAKGDTITVHATGIVKETDKKFWSTKDPGQQPFTYQAGVGCVRGQPSSTTIRATFALVRTPNTTQTHPPAHLSVPRPPAV